MDDESDDLSKDPIYEILEGQLFVSSMWAARDHHRSFGITHVLCVADEAFGAVKGNEVVVADFDGMDLEDDGSSGLAYCLPHHVAFIDEAFSAPTGRCLVHCRLGVNRSGVVVVAYLMARRGMTYVDALAHAKERRPGLELHPRYDEKMRAMLPDFDWHVQQPALEDDDSKPRRCCRWRAASQGSG